MDQCVMRRVGARAGAAIGFLCFVSLSSLGAAWSPPVDVSLPAQISQSPQADVDLNGNVTAVWSTYNGTNWIVQAATEPLGGCWPSVSDNLSLPGQDATLPQIAVDAMGNATVVWQRSDGSNQVIQSSTKPYGGSWQSTPDTLSLTGRDAVTPQIAVDPMGNATAVWSRSNGLNKVIQASTRPFNGSWQSPDNLSPFGLLGQDAYSPQIAIDGVGNATAVWQQHYASGPVTISASTKLYGGTWQSPYTLDDSNVHESSSPQIAVDSMGNATAVWQRDDLLHQLGSLIIQSSTKPYGGTWQTTPDNLSLVGQDSIAPQIAIDGFGNATVVWAGASSIQASTRPYGGTWQVTPDTLSQPGQMAAYPRIAVTSSGIATVVWAWTYYTETITVIQASTKPYGGSWQATPSDLSQPIVGANVETSPPVVPTPSLVVDTNGNSTALWQNYNGNNPRYNPISSLFYLNSWIIQSSTNTTVVAPPAYFTGVVWKGEDLLLKTKWKKSAARDIVCYEIFARDTMVKRISAHDDPKATIRLNPEHMPERLTKGYRQYLQNKYKIRTVYSTGAVSAFTALNIEH